MMANFANIRYLGEYYHYVVGLLDRSGIVLSRASLSKSIVMSSTAYIIGEILAPDVGSIPDTEAAAFSESNGIVFRDGSFLRFVERVRISRRTGTEIFDYSYHYQRPGEDFFVRFDFEKTPAANLIFKPQHHLHTSAKPELHLPSAQIDLDFVLKFINVNFFRNL